jgi:hypothetical protein
MRVVSYKIICLLVAVVCCLSSATISGQQARKKTAKPPVEDTKLAQQQELIGRLVGVANDLKGEADKPGAALLQSEVADVLWRFDEPAARTIFRLAFDTVRDDIANNSSAPSDNSNSDSITQSRRRVSAIRTILKRYGLRDRKSADAWLQEFDNDIKAKQTNSTSGYRISPEQAELLADIALGMVSQDPKEAQRLGLLSLSAAKIPLNFERLLMALRDRDKALSDILFRQALLSMRTNAFAYDAALMALTNYTFFADGTRFPDALPADIALIIQYLVDAAGAQAALSRSGTMRTGTEQNSLGGFYSFFTTRGSRIVALNAPDKAVLLQSNVGEIAQALTADQRGQAEMFAAARQQPDSQSSETGSDLDSRIRRAEQEKSVATRDFLFRSLVLQMMRSDSERALEVARKIDDQELRAQTEDDVYLILMRKAYSSGAEAAIALALKFNDPSRRARWLVQIAGSRSQDQTEKSQLLSQAYSIAVKSDNTPVKIDVLLLIAKEFLRFDQDRGFEILSEAVGATNRIEKTPVKRIKPAVPVMRVISMTVVDGQEVSTDDRVTVESIDFNQLGAFAERDYLRTSFLANDIKNRFLKSKYFIALARSVLQVPRQGSGYERTLDDLISN